MRELQLPGLEDTARLSLTAYLHADGGVSHYELEGRSPDGALTHFRAQASCTPFKCDPAYPEILAWFEKLVFAAARDQGLTPNGGEEIGSP